MLDTELSQNLADLCNYDEEEPFTPQIKKFKLSMPSPLLAIEKNKLKLLQKKVDVANPFFRAFCHVGKLWICERNALQNGNSKDSYSHFKMIHSQKN